MTQRKLNWLISAVAAVSIAGLTTSTFAQVRVNNGNARDANNRIGSGGSNGGGGERVGNTVSNNDIVYGNVTGGRQFRGALGTTDLRSFHGGTASGNGVSGFIRQSNGAPTGLNSVNNAQVVGTYYDANAKGVNAPAGFTQQAIGSTGYVPAPPPTRGSGDLRIGAVIYDDTIAAPRAGEAMLPGMVNTSNTNSLVTASPLYGVRQWNNDDNQSILNNSSFRSISDQSLDDQTLQQFRAELEVPAMPTQNLAGKAQINAGAATLQNGAQSTPNLAQPQGVPLGQATDKPLPNGQLPGENLGASNLGGGLQTNQGTQQRLLSGPAQQSTQYQLMEDQLKSYLGQQGYSTLQANRDYNASVAKQKELDAAASAKRAAPAGNAPGAAGPGNGAVGAAGGNTPTGLAPAPSNLAGEKPGPSAPGPTLQAPAEKPKPVQVHSLAEGINAAGLKQIMTQAEDQMRQGKWISAIESYQNAVRVAPNNPLVIIGRANAELGATYYARAEEDLKTAFLGDKKILMGQFDLRKMIGDDRLSYLLTDLKEMNNKDPKKTTALFLLAYIAYNTGSEQQAAGYLDMIEQRDKGNSAVKTLKQYWMLPGQEKSAAPATPELNK